MRCGCTICNGLGWNTVIIISGGDLKASSIPCGYCEGSGIVSVVDLATDSRVKSITDDQPLKGLYDRQGTTDDARGLASALSVVQHGIHTGGNDD